MRSLVRAFTRLLMSPDWLGVPISRLAGPSSYVSIQRKAFLESRFQARCASYFSPPVVESGPFSGMRYETRQSHGSALYPKLLGTYEAELHPAILSLRSRTYDDIIDVGFAEGYYLIGLSRWFPAATAWGFDLSTEAHELCAGLASINNISTDRLRLDYEANDDSLFRVLGRRSLVICDCEGFEANLFAADRVDRWQRSDLIIECHDFIEPGVTDSICSSLEVTHEVEVIPSMDCRLKIGSLSSEARAAFSTHELARLVSEGRPASQSWIVGRARQLMAESDSV